MANRYNPQIHHRRSIRLKSYDYNRAGAYFVTICVQARECLLGTITDKILHLNEYRKIVEQVWNYLPRHFENLEIDAAVIMPNHFHGILICTEPETTDFPVPPPKDAFNAIRNKGDRPFYEQKTNLGKIIAYFKYQTTKKINQKRGLVGTKIWQKNYYEHIIRHEKSLNILREYIENNPYNWHTDQLHPNIPSKW
ncbi:transposase [Picosynechococcus sp. PCC 7117]|uniref:transposase n=1 Tax=Picosynechococcus sp. PCC 7117 TaxID=195498 RepID=UPI000810807B|nr:transposase [Picosynechococcus sp. PCC 7117]ANV86444.1 transposase [Picosynechococcus sp. PCC 7117]